MKKLGVETQTPKTASKKTTCPKCGRDVQKSGAVVKCPTHGTEPFEHETVDTEKD